MDEKRSSATGDDAGWLVLGSPQNRTEWVRGQVTPIYLVWIEITDAGRAALSKL